MPRSKREGILLSLIMSLIMIYVMAALNDNVRLGEFAASSWLLACLQGAQQSGRSCWLLLRVLS